MVMNDLLFRTQLNYQIQANTPEETDSKVDLSAVRDIDIHRCYFDDFKKAMKFMREYNTDFDFSDFTIDAVKPAPADFSESKKYDFVELTEFAKHTAITIGNMALFSELQKIASAAEQFNYSVASHDNHRVGNILSFEDYDNYEIKEQPNIVEELGSCVIGGGNEEALKLTATFHESSTVVHPIISIRAFSLTSNSYLTNRDIIDLDTIYKPNASLMEIFAYLSYMDHMGGSFNKSFDRLVINGGISIDSLDDMYAKHYDLSHFD